ncbi:MAG: hypothetical protein AB1806_15765 [Acidobacteriota bacterium]
MHHGHRRPAFVLNIHADYGCRQSGACCSAGWDIPVGPDVAARLEAALHDGRLRTAGTPAPGLSALVRTPAPPAGAAAVLGKDASGGCVFLDRDDHNHCIVHRNLGQDLLPEACRHFPRITLLDRRGVHVTLSHFCPTAAAMLLRDDVTDLCVVEDAPRRMSGPDDEGFDATRTIPPLLRPGVAFDLDAYTRWEAWQIAVLGRDDLGAEQAIETIAHAADLLRSWTPARGALLCSVEQAAADAGSAITARPRAVSRRPQPCPRAAAAPLRTYRSIAGLVRPGLPAPAEPPEFGPTFTSFVEPVWAEYSRPVRRYVAAKAFAAWSAYQGEGVRTNAAVLGVVLDVLKVECVGQTQPARRPLDARLLCEAFRRSDLLLEHLVDRIDLVRRLAPVESLEPGRWLTAFPFDDRPGFGDPLQAC